MSTVKLTPQRKRTLVFFYRREIGALPMPTMTEIAELHGTTTDTVKTHLRLLVRDGVLEVSHFPGRRRQYEYWLTHDGRRAARVLYEKAAKEVARISEQNYRSMLQNLQLPRFRQEGT